MHAVGIRELKNRLSHYLRLVRQGEEIEITDRGEVVASLGPPRRTAPEGLPAELVELARQGRARLGAPNRPELYRKRKRVCERDVALAILDELRGER
jgi:antitoxin (DNA-binding transcriptional repressor) of toxin-antitoxin stability system